ncbi:MAG: Branched-chain amino acid transporter, amino acid-binding protein [Verrucomicrobiales bacterium]|nr:Branched-chain amino acid transporter, amino acid-binding protein [Verrucomicrobiales bacterium]
MHYPSRVYHLIILVFLGIYPTLLPARTPAIAGRAGFSVFLKSDGTVWAVGNNRHGQLGDGTTTDRSTIVPVMSGVQAIMASGDNSLFLKTAGTVYNAGSNALGQVGDGTFVDRSIPVLVLSGVQSMAGGGHSLFLKTDGTVQAVGFNDYGQLGDGTVISRSTPVPVTGLDNVSALAAGSVHSLFLKMDGTAMAVGFNKYGLLGDGTTADRRIPVPVMSDVKAIAGAEQHSLFLKTDGTVWAAGRNQWGQLGDGTLITRIQPVPVLSDVQSIAANGYYSLFLKIDGSVWATGINNYGQLGDGTTEFRKTPVLVMSGVQSIAAGWAHNLFLKTDGTVWGGGSNMYGELGLKRSTPFTSTPVRILSLIVPPPTRWQKEQFGEQAENSMIAGWTADPDGDDVPNLLEWAFSLLPLKADRTVLSEESVIVSGLPSISVIQKPDGAVLAMRYSRIKGAVDEGLIYTPEFSFDPVAQAGEWSPVTGSETVEALESGWERVTVEDAVRGSLAPRFARIRLTLAP